MAGREVAEYLSSEGFKTNLERGKKKKEKKNPKQQNLPELLS